MKLSTPEDMDEMGEPDERVNDAVEGIADPDATVSIFDGEMAPLEAIRFLGDIVEEPEAFGLSSEALADGVDKRLVEIEEMVEQNQKAIGEIAEAVDLLAGQQGKISGKSVELDPEPLSGIYDPTEEFENGN